MKQLAIHGGVPVISERIQIKRDVFTENDQKAVRQYLALGGVNSYYGDEGQQHEYEDELKNYFGYNYCVLTNSGTNALLSAYFALGLMPGDEVLVPAFSFFAVATPLLILHLTPVMVDCSKETGLIDPNDAISKITDRTKAVIINHICGDSIDMLCFSDYLHKKHIALIEDISLAFGGFDSGKKLGTFADISCCSLGSTKMLSGGQGGFLITDKREYYERAILLGCFGKRALQNVYNPYYRQFCNVSYGMNNRMHPLAIAISFSRFQMIDRLISDRTERYMLLSSCIDSLEGINSPRMLAYKTRGSWHGYYAVLSEGLIPYRNKIVAALCAEGLQVTAGAHYPLLHKEKIFLSAKDGFYRTKENLLKGHTTEYPCPNAERYQERIISFPLFLDEEKNLLMLYCEGLLKVFNNIDQAIW